jgi:carboxyl-terminal processing protease
MAIKIVTLIRDEIVQDETFARSAIVKEGGSRIGYIYLPEFYADFDHPNGAAAMLTLLRKSRN